MRNDDEHIVMSFRNHDLVNRLIGVLQVMCPRKLEEGLISGATAPRLQVVENGSGADAVQKLVRNMCGIKMYAFRHLEILRWLQ